MINETIVVSLEVSVLSTLLATVPGIAMGLLLALHKFQGRDAIVTIMYTALAFPTVVVGLLVYYVLSRHGPLGSMGLLYTKSAIVVGQWVLIVPIISTFTYSAIRRIDPALIQTAHSLGASGIRLYMTLAREARFGIIAAIVAAFGRAVSEVGVSMILGGNIEGFTRTMTTAIALEHDKGQFGEALILGTVLLAISLGINVLFHAYQNSPEDRHAAN